MIHTWLFSLVSVFCISLISLIGVLLLYSNMERLKLVIFGMVSLSVGALFGEVFIHIIPELSTDPKQITTYSLVILLGIIIFFALEKFLHLRHDHHVHHNCEHGPQTVGYLNLISDAMHNFIDGIIIGSAYLVDVSFGIATTLAVALHELPQEIGDMGILLYAGFSKSKAIVFNFISACTSFLGVIIALLIGTQIEHALGYILALAAGSFLYIAGSDLVPELNKTTKNKEIFVQFVGIVLGIGLMYSLTLFE